jgi:hypothetical protein
MLEPDDEKKMKGLAATASPARSRARARRRLVPDTRTTFSVERHPDKEEFPCATPELRR